MSDEPMPERRGDVIKVDRPRDWPAPPSPRVSLQSPNLAHTPGPWRVKPNRGPYSHFIVHDIDEDGELYSVVAKSGGLTPEIAAANARLISKAPVLLDTIERAMALLHPSQPVSEAARDLTFAILRAAMEELVG